MWQHIGRNMALRTLLPRSESPKTSVRASSMDDAAIVADIRERVTSGQYEIDFEHVDYHVATEGFIRNPDEQAKNHAKVGHQW